VPIGFAHGFCVLSEAAEVQYKCSAVYNAKTECTAELRGPGSSRALAHGAAAFVGPRPAGGAVCQFFAREWGVEGFGSPVAEACWRARWARR